MRDTQALRPEQRFTKDRQCPICGGWNSKPRGKGERCYGFVSEDGAYAHCTREEYAGDIEMKPNSKTFPHRLTGDCRCGVRHGETTPASLTADERPTPQERTRAREIAYEYPDADGNTLFRVLRTPDKRYFQQVPNGAGGWKNGLNGTQPVLYHLDKITYEYDKAKPLFVVEGEKDANRLISEGLQATTAPMGAEKWRPEYAEQLAGFEDVRIIPDNDDTGRRHAEQIAASL